MEVIIPTILIFAIAMTGLSLGVIFRGKQIKGHCGGASLEEGCAGDCSGDGNDSCIEKCSTCTCDSERV